MSPHRKLPPADQNPQRAERFPIREVLAGKYLEDHINEYLKANPNHRVVCGMDIGLNEAVVVFEYVRPLPI